MDQQKYEMAKWLFVMSIGLALESVGLGFLALVIIFKASWPRHRRRRKPQIPPMVVVPTPRPAQPPVVSAGGSPTRLMPKPSSTLSYYPNYGLTKANLHDDHE